MIEDLLLDGMQPVFRRDSLDRRDFLAVALNCQHQASADQTFVDNDAARTAITGRTTLLRALQADFFTEHFQQRLLGFAEKFDGFVVDAGRYVYLIHCLTPIPLRLFSPGTIACDRACSATQHRDDLPAVIGGTALVGDRRRGFSAGLSRRTKGGSVQRGADQSLASRRHQ